MEGNLNLLRGLHPPRLPSVPNVAAGETGRTVFVTPETEMCKDTSAGNAEGVSARTPLRTSSPGEVGWVPIPQAEKMLKCLVHICSLIAVIIKRGDDLLPAK